MQFQNKHFVFDLKHKNNRWIGGFYCNLLLLSMERHF